MNFYLSLARVFAFLVLFFPSCYGQNASVDALLNVSTWNALFPNRAGTAAGHPQGYVSDFYSFDHFKQAVTEMADFKATIRLKNGVWGQVITVTRKSSNTTYNYQEADANWYANSTPETVIVVDFKDFITRGSAYTNKRELGAFLAHISKETTGGWQTPVGGGSSGDYAKWGLYFVHELGYTSANAAGAYSQPHADYPPNPSQGYYGRGPIQLSWNYNYGQFSSFIYNDKQVLLNDPNRLQNDGVLALKSAIWFWMMPQCPKPSCHQVMHDLFSPIAGGYTASKMYTKGFAHTNNIINGGLECRASSSSVYTQKVALRSALYKYYLATLGLSTAEISAEDSNGYSTFCYEDALHAMEDYQRCEVSQLHDGDFNVGKLAIYPNPVVDRLVISHDERIAKVAVYSVVGELVLTRDVNAASVVVDASSWVDGLYFVVVELGNNRRYCSKVVRGYKL